jgi:hypothetical protein
MNLLAAIDPTTATFVLAVCVLIAGLLLAIVALKATTTDTKSGQAFAAVGVLFGLLAAGGLGGLFANSVAQSAADASATKATDTATEQVSEEVGQLSQQIEGALEPSASGAGKGEAGGAGE